jgi:hypothetical protein
LTAVSQVNFPSCDIRPARWQAPSIAPYHHWVLNGGRTWATFHRIDDGYLVRFPGFADFVIASDGASATCHPCPGLSAATCEHLFLNQIWPLMQSQQGMLVFHGSAIEAGSSAIAFFAASGRGKSTLAAAFGVGGARYLADDALAIEQTGSVHMVHPGHPSIRLWDDSRIALLEAVTRSDPVSYTSKARILSATGLVHCTAPRPLAAAFFLGDGAADRIELRSVSGADAVAAWVAHTFILDPQDNVVLHRHFNEITTLAARVPCYHLDYPRRYDALDEVRAAILEAVSPKEPDT